MEPERWLEIERLYHLTREMEAGARAGFLEQACRDDADLRREVESLLQCEDGAEEQLRAGVRAAAAALAGERAERLIGETVSHYRVIDKVGGGGMGVVYRALDLRLRREVALKVLAADTSRDQTAAERFEREALAAAALNHPNICTVYEVGEDGGRPFLAMELLQGETLKDRIGGQPLPLSCLLDWAAQVAEGLEAAHARGIVHRDIKPANLFITARGQLKILDFGVAKLAHTGPSHEAAPTVTSDHTQLTVPGATVGTLAYMSPEQARGEELDARTDLFSCGAVVYEMATGRTAFAGNTAAVIFDAILNREVRPPLELNPGLPPELERIIHKALEKEREQRYQSAAEMLADLKNVPRTPEPARPRKLALPVRWQPTRRLAVWALAAAVLIGMGAWVLRSGLQFRRPADNKIDSVAVLPLANATGDPSADYLTDGITEDLINGISQIPGVKVMSRSAVFHYKAKDLDAQSVGRRLGVRAVLTGLVAKDGRDLAISVELVDVTSNGHLWGQRYVRPPEDLASLQQDISSDLANRLISQADRKRWNRARKHDTENPDAYLLYVKGRYYWNKRTQEGFQKGIEYFKQAIDKNPAYAQAYSGLADCYMFLDGPPAETLAKARAAAQKALEIDDSIAAPHASLGYIYFSYDWNWPDAEREFVRAIELDPNYLSAHSYYANYLSAMGRADEAIAESKRAVALDPLALGPNTGLGLRYYFARRYQLAIQQYQKTLELDRSFLLARQLLGLAYVQNGRIQNAIREFEEMAAAADDDDVSLNLAYAYARAGRRSDAMRQVQKVSGHRTGGYPSPYVMAYVYAALGEPDRAFQLLAQAYKDRDGNLHFLRVQPELDGLRSDQRFKDLLKRLRLD